MVMRMKRSNGALLTFVMGLVGCASSEVQFAPGCADEFYEAVVTFPNGTSHTFCGPASADGIAIVFDTPLRGCRVLGAYGDTTTPEASLGVGGNAEWISDTGRKELVVTYDPHMMHAERCPPGLPPGSCVFRNNACALEVSRAARSAGDIVEGRLAAPCRLGDPVGGSWNPVVTSMRFRAHLSDTRVINDAGETCTFPPS